MTVEVVLAPRDAAGPSAPLADAHKPDRPNFRHRLAKGKFDARFAPDDAQVSAVADYLRQSGLALESASSQFRLRATGPSSLIETTFRTSIYSSR